MADIQQASAKQKVFAAAAALALVTAPMTASFEGLVTHPNPDPANPKLEQVCYGDTEVEMRVYTRDQCGAMLRRRLAKDYAPHMITCVPALISPQNRWRGGALLDASYNGGWPAACRSPMATEFNRGRWTAGCYAFPHWRTLPGTRVHNGLLRRRMAERALCLKGAAR